jgi:hypothetical protein
VIAATPKDIANIEAAHGAILVITRDKPLSLF